MNHYLFKQLRFVRNNTITSVKGVSEEMVQKVPEKFNNHIKWHLGHIFVVQEKFPLQLMGEEVEIPKNYPTLFSPGTKPSDWGNDVPSVDEIILLLKKQIDRIEQKVANQLNYSFEEPYSTSTGLELLTVEESLSFCLYHEGMHFQAIKEIKRLL